MTEAALFPLPDPPARTAGPVRAGLDVEVAAAEAAGTELSASGVAQLRMLADHLDGLDAFLWRSRSVKPFDRVPLTQLAAQFDDTYARVFGNAPGGDGLERALADFNAAEARNAQGPVPTN